jgi:CubicO group peptidase (beta-lactamase class C family)
LRKTLAHKRKEEFSNNRGGGVPVNPQANVGRTHIIRSFRSLVLVSLLATLCFAEKKDDTPKPAQSIEELRQQIEKVLQDTHTPGMSIAIVHRDGSEWIAGLGKADVAGNRAATADTLFRIGSTSKAFVSLAILKLVNEGRLSLGDPVRKLAPEVRFENRWEATDPVRVVHLLEHTTGWDDVSLREFAKNAPGIGLREALDYDPRSRVSRWRPGTRMAYCNSGPVVAAYIVEKITGERFEDYVQQNFFGPIGMKTATYFQPALGIATTLYHSDGKTPFPYWNVIDRPAGSINASAKDMANYVLFYLNRGAVNGVQVMPPTSIERMESPTSTWAAKDGMKNGYGLGNYWTIDQGFVFHGHNGGLAGARAEMMYMPDYGVGFFYALNTARFGAYQQTGKLIRAYITRKLERPPVPPVAAMPANATQYTGWYEPASSRNEMLRFLERLLGLNRVRFEDGKLLLSSLTGIDDVYLPVVGGQFRYVPTKDPAEPAARLDLLSPNADGQIIQLGMDATLKRIPGWLAITEITLTLFVALALVSVLVYAPFWILGGLSKKRRRPAERRMRLWPLVAALSLVSFFAVFVLTIDDLISQLGNLTAWSAAVFLSTIIFAVASVASGVVLWRVPKQEVRASVRTYSTVVTVALLIATAYLAYWGVIGWRTWA